MGIDGVPQPEKVVPKEDGAAKVAQKIASAVGDAVDAAKTLLADTDDSQEHNEL
jgi:FK506-binding protein 2